ncbi:MAG TPA: hypothetical protein PKE05_02835 [Microthrixaceae bacterium]|nr:hypothetical protein [Microthrixaceae bacterium]
MSDVPAWLTEAVVSAPGDSDPALREESPVDVLPGDICTVAPFGRSEGPRRLFLVVEAGDGWCEGMIASVETELATEVDVLLPAAETGLGYPIAIHTRYLGPVWTTQVQRRVGAVAADTLAEIERLAWNDEAQVAVRVGLPLQPEDIDSRYPALRSLSAELNALTDHCRRRRGELDQPVLDPALADVVVLQALLAERGWELKVGSALSTPAFRDRLLVALPLLSPDERRAVMPLLERATVADPAPAVAVDAMPALAGHSQPDALGRTVASRAEGTVVTVLSHWRCWHKSPSGPARVQIAAREEWIVFESFSDVPLAEVA